MTSTWKILRSTSSMSRSSVKILHASISGRLKIHSSIMNEVLRIISHGKLTICIEDKIFLLFFARNQDEIELNRDINIQFEFIERCPSPKAQNECLDLFVIQYHSINRDSMSKQFSSVIRCWQLLIQVINPSIFTWLNMYNYAQDCHWLKEK